jgi:hypothetical protein
VSRAGARPLLRHAFNVTAQLDLLFQQGVARPAVSITLVRKAQAVLLRHLLGGLQQGRVGDHRILGLPFRALGEDDRRS